MTTTNPYKDYKVPGASSDGLYLKFVDSEPQKVRIISEPYIFNSVFGEGEAAKISQKFAWLVYNVTEQKGQVMQLPVTAYRDVASFAADPDWGDPTQYGLTITRTGKGPETRYQIVPSPNKTALTPEQTDSVKSIDITAAVKGALPLSQVIEEKVDINKLPAGNTATTPDDGRFDNLKSEVHGEINLDDIPF